MIFTPRPYQQLIKEHILKHRCCAIWAGMGMGKTSATLDALCDLLLCEGPVLVIGPLRVAQSVWPLEVEKWSTFHDLRVSPIIGEARVRAKAADLDADIYTINYENLQWLAEHFKGALPYKIIVADESTRLKGFRLGGKGAKRARALAKAMGAPRFIELTGTPSPNGLQDLWGQFWFLDRGLALGKTFTAFLHRWFRPIRFGAAQFVEWEAMPHAEAEIIDRCSGLALSLRAQDWFPDLLEPLVHEVPVYMPKSIMERYRQLEKEMYTQLETGEDIDVANAAAKSIKCLQFASGAVYTDSKGAYAEVHDLKIQALESIIEEAAGMPVLVAYHFKTDLERLLKKFPRGRALDRKSCTLRDWNAGNIPVLFAHPASAGHGLNLQNGGNILVFFSHWWDFEQRAQIIERIGPTRQLQAGHNRHVHIYNIIAKGTIDSTVLRRHDTKESVHDALMNARKVTPCKP